MNTREYLKKILPKPIKHFYWLIKVLRIKIITWIPRYDEDEIITGHYPDFIEDKHFINCYNSAVKIGLAVSDKIRWRAHTLCWAGKAAKNLEGDFVECGVAKGFVSKIVMDYIGFENIPKTFFLMDTYDGLEKYFGGGGGVISPTKL